jgi:hypothetical protein
MKIKTITIFFITILIACNHAPEIVVNIDALRQSTDSIRNFSISNPGTDTLIIEDFTSSCECTALNLINGQKISPKDSLVVQVKINREEQDADNEVFVTIKTNAKPRLTSFHFRP